MKLKEGIYENIISNKTNADINETETAGLVCQITDLDKAESSKMLADYLAQSIMKKLDEKESTVEAKIKMVNDVLEKTKTSDEDAIMEPKLLSAVISQQLYGIGGM